MRQPHQWRPCPAVCVLGGHARLLLFSCSSSNSSLARLMGQEWLLCSQQVTPGPSRTWHGILLPGCTSGQLGHQLS